MREDRVERTVGFAPLASVGVLPQHGEPLVDVERARSARISGNRSRLFVPSAAWGGRNRRELLAASLLGAFLFHVLLVAAIVEVPGLLPPFLRPTAVKPPPPPPEADLVMVKENTPTVGGTPPPPPKQAPPSTKPQQQQEQQQPAGGSKAQGFDAPNGEAVPPPQATELPDPGKQQQAKLAQATPPPAPPPAPPKSNIQVNLDLDGQPGWGLVDDRTIAASPDDRYINKPAAYPRGAGMRGEEGVVYLATLVAPDGHAEQVTIEQSSGYADLDLAARNAVAAWRFRPSIQGGVAVESQMRLAYHFTISR